MKKAYLWASPDTRGKLETPHDCKQPLFFGTDKTVAVPFGRQVRVMAQFPCEYHLVQNGSFGDHFIEGTYLYSAPVTPSSGLGHDVQHSPPAKD